MKATLIPLEVIDIRNPCKVPWDQMAGDEHSRFCGDCKQHVFNLAALTRPEAEALIREKEGRLCLRLFRRADGTVLTKECFGGWMAVRRRLALIVAAACAIVVGTGAVLFGFPVRAVPTHRGASSIRDIEPFRTVLNLIAPQPVMGAPCPLPAIPPVPPPTGPSAPPVPSAATSSPSE